MRKLVVEVEGLDQRRLQELDIRGCEAKQISRARRRGEYQDCGLTWQALNMFDRDRIFKCQNQAFVKQFKFLEQLVPILQNLM